MLRSSAAILLLPLAVAGDTPRLAHAKGTEVTRTWTLESTRVTESATLTMNENPQDIGSGSTHTSVYSVEVKDEILAVEDGAPTRFLRTFETIDTDSSIDGLEMGDDMEFKDGSGTSELVGASVLFDWSADTEEWDRAYDEDSFGDEDWLEDLVAPMDMSAILPDDDASVGDTWDVPMSILDALLRPGGELHVRDDGDEGGEEGTIRIEIPSVRDFSQWSELEGTVEATYAELVEEDGPRIARIVLEIDVEGDLDIAAELEQNSAEDGRDETYTSAELSRSLKGKITVDWDLGAGHFVALEGELDGTSEFYGAWTISAQGFEIDLEVERAEEFDFDIKASIE